MSVATCLVSGPSVSGSPPDHFVQINRAAAKKAALRHPGCRHVLMSAYERDMQRDGILVANTRMRQTCERLVIAGDMACSAAMWPEQVEERARRWAQWAVGMVRGVADMDEVACALKSWVEACGLGWPARYADSDSPERRREKTVGAILRALDWRWYRRRLAAMAARATEAALIAAGECRHDRHKYVTGWGMARVRAQRARTADVVKTLELVSAEGHVVPMDEVIERSVSAPRNRIAEAFARINGLEAWAIEQGLVGEFITLTCPSRFHAAPVGCVRVSEKWEEAGRPTPKDGAGYLQGVWSRARAALARKKIKIAGFRVAEPHQDGTPHWHGLVYARPEQMPVVLQILRDHALADSPDEYRAAEVRFVSKTVIVDPERGYSAAAYCAKYLFKGIAGAGTGAGHADVDTGMPELWPGAFELSPPASESTIDSAAERVSAWASLWGIRQFQFFGMPPIGVWRVMRKMPSVYADKGADRLRDIGVAAPLEDARLCADRSDFGGWVRSLLEAGGARVLRLSAGVGKYASERVRTIGIQGAGWMITLAASGWTIRGVWDRPAAPAPDVPWSWSWSGWSGAWWDKCLPFVG